MTDLTTTHLKCLLEQAAPGPWEARDNYLDDGTRPDDSYQMRDAAGDYLGIMHGQDSYLAALAPELARELLVLRDALADVIQIWQYASTDPERTPIEQNLAARVVDHINEALGDHDE